MSSRILLSLCLETYHHHHHHHHHNNNTGHFIMFSVITNIYNKKTKGPTLMELFTATRKLKKFFLQRERFDVCTTGDTAHIYTIFKFFPHTRQYGCIDILRCYNDPPWGISICSESSVLHTSNISTCKKKERFSVFLWLWTISLRKVFDFLVTNICNHGEHYETPCITCGM
jgi:hypothetical protein